MKLASTVVAGFAALVLCAGIAAAAPPPDEHGGPDRPAGHEEWQKKACTEPLARMKSHLEELKVRLSLTDAQRPLWDKWSAAVEESHAKAEAECLKDVAAPPKAPPTIVERLAKMQERLAGEAARLQASQPALAALYQALTPEQRDSFEHGVMMGHGGPGGGFGHHGHGWGEERDGHRHHHHCHHGHHGHHGHDGHDGWGHDGWGDKRHGDDGRE